MAVAISPKGTLALVSNYQDGSLSPITLPSLTVGAPVAGGAGADRRLHHPGRAGALVADFQTSTVTPIDLSAMAPGPAIAVGGNPTGIAGAPSSGTAYVSGGDSVTPIDLADPVRRARPIDVGTTAEALAVAPGGTTAWVCGGDGTLVHVDLRTAR